MRDSGAVTIRSADPGQERTPHYAASPGGHEAATWRQHREERELSEGWERSETTTPQADGEMGAEGEAVDEPGLARSG